jgi:HD-like signal output (HDOD) protein
MKSILFVDDEPNVLSGLKRMLRGLGGRYEMYFTGSGIQALELMRDRPFDIVVADMRMPGMDGAQLLLEVRRRHPRTVRIILSGDFSPLSVLKSVKPAHQHLAKPCEAAKLISVLERASLLSDFLGQEELAGLVSQMESLPAMTDEYELLMAELDAEEPSLPKVAEIIGRDMAMAATVLKVVNSAFFGLGRRVHSLFDAVTLLGLDVVKALVVSAKVFEVFERHSLPGFSLAYLWRHCVNTAGVAKAIAQTEESSRNFVDEAYIGGLLHDLGKLVLVSLLPERYRLVLERVRAENILIWQAEKDLLGATHAEVGAYLTGLWGFSDGIVHALAFHHAPELSPERAFCPMIAVHVANYCEHKYRVVHEHYAQRQLATGHLQDIGLGENLPGWLKLAKEAMESEARHDGR